MNCPACGIEIDGTAKFCPECGAPTGTPAPETLSGSETAGPGTRVATSSPQLAAGEMFHERYRVDRVLGQGGMGTVYLARDSVTSDPVCLKVVRPELVRSESLAQRFLREGKLTRSLRHPNIVAVYDVNATGGSHYLSMEFIEGQSLRDWIRGNLRSKRSVPHAVAGGLVREILLGLGAAHAAGVIHRDLKPENVMLLGDPDAGDFRLKILDFGIARALDSGEQLTVVGSAMGTPVYMAPEQETSAEAVGPESDLYSVGVIFYEILLGVPPRGRWDLPTAVRPELPKSIDGFLETALHAHPSRRYPSVDEMSKTLEAALAGVAKPPPGKTPPPVPRKPGVDWAAAWGLKSGELNKLWGSKTEWFMIWCYTPCLASITWWKLYGRTKDKQHLTWAMLYLIPLVTLLGLVGAMEEGDDETVGACFVLITIGWVIAMVHAYQVRKDVAKVIEPPAGDEK